MAPRAPDRKGGHLFWTTGVLGVTRERRVLQRFVEETRLNRVEGVSGLVEVQRAYGVGRSFLEQEDERIMKTVQTMGETR